MRPFRARRERRLRWAAEVLTLDVWLVVSRHWTRWWALREARWFAGKVDR